MMIPVYINNFNRLAPILAMLDDFQRFNDVTPLQVILVDNASDYPPLLDWMYSYRQGDYPFPMQLYLRSNGGPRGWWPAHLENKHPYHIVSDSDIDYSQVPGDLFEHMIKALVDFPDKTKVGPSLRLDDIPHEHPLYNSIMSIELPFSCSAYNDEWWEALIDTTCFAARTGQGFTYGPGLRAKEPYVVRHLSWYSLPGKLTEEEQYYLDHIAPEHRAGIVYTAMMQDSKKYGSPKSIDNMSAS